MPLLLAVGIIAAAYFLSQQKSGSHELTEVQAKAYITSVIKNKKRTRDQVQKAYELAVKYKMTVIAGKLHSTLDRMK